MQDYVNQLLHAINAYSPDDLNSANKLRDLVCWISDQPALKNDKFVAELLYIASQKMRVFGYNVLNHFSEDPLSSTSALSALQGSSITNLYQSSVYSNNILDKSQKDIVDLFQSLQTRRLLVSAPTSYGKTFLMREILYLNRDRYNNILLIFPTIALLLENARTLEKYVSDKHLDYRIIKTVDGAADSSTRKIFVFTPERSLQLMASFPNLKIDFFFFDEVYKIDEDFCISDDEPDSAQNFLNEDRGKTFRISLYLLSKSVNEYYLAGPNLTWSKFGAGMQRFIKLNHITVKEIQFEPTLRVSVSAHSRKIEEQLPSTLTSFPGNSMVPVKLEKRKNDKVKNVIDYINRQSYGKTLLYCKSPSKAVEYSVKLSDRTPNDILETYPDEFKEFINHIQKEYSIEDSADNWSLIKILRKGFGLHHGKLPKYFQQEILDQFNKGTFHILFCTSTIVEGVNTNAQNVIILNASKGQEKLTPFDIKNIKGRAGRYYHCFVGRVFYMSKELESIESSNSYTLDFITYSNKSLSTIDLDNALLDDLTPSNQVKKIDRDKLTSSYFLPEEIFIQNRTISKENQEKLAQTLLDDTEFSKYLPLFLHGIDLDNFLTYHWISKILNAFFKAQLLDEPVIKKFAATANNYASGGFKSILKYEIQEFQSGKRKSIDDAYANAFHTQRDILEHKIPKILSLFESVASYVAQKKGISTDDFSLSKIRRYYETGVKTPLGEALIEYGFPLDAIRRIEDRHSELKNLSISEAKLFCREHYRSSIQFLLDKYENALFIKAMNTFK